MKITASFIKKELDKLAFFVQYSGFFDQFPVRSKEVFENLPIEWTKVDTGGETQLEWQEEPAWSTALLEGKLNDTVIKIHIKRDSSRNIYTLIYEGKQYKTSNLNELQKIIEDISEGSTPKPKLMQSAFNIIQKNKSQYFQYVKDNFLKEITFADWEFKLSKDVKRIYLRFFVKGIETEEKMNIQEKLKEHNYYRIDAIGTYLKKMIKEAGTNIDEIKFLHKFISLPNQAGFIITIK